VNHKALMASKLQVSCTLLWLQLRSQLLRLPLCFGHSGHHSSQDRNCSRNKRQDKRSRGRRNLLLMIMTVPLDTLFNMLETTRLKGQRAQGLQLSCGVLWLLQSQLLCLPL
jgi:hypothetical protein